MISKTLFLREWKANLKIVAIFLIVLSFYGGIIVAMYDPKLGESLNLMADSMPGLFEAFGMSNPGSNLLEFVGNYLYGFILVAFPLVFLVLMCNRLIARYVDRGSMAYLLATPNKRTKIISTQALTLILSTAVLVIYATLLVIVCGQMMFQESLDLSKFLLVNIGLLGLLLFFAGLNFLSCCIFNETKLATGLGAGISILFLLIQMLATVSDKIALLKYLTPMTLFSAKDIIAGHTEATLCFLALYAMAALMFGAGILIFKKKDLSL